MVATRWRRLAGEVVVVVLSVGVDLYVYDGDRGLRGGGLLASWVVPVAVCLVFATLFLRWRNPVEVFALQWVYGLAGLLLPGYAPFAGVLVALHAAASRLPTRLSLAVLALAFVPFVVDDANTAASQNGWPQFAVLCFVWAVILAAVWAVGHRTHLTERRGAMVAEAEAARAVEAVHAERMRLARELHDIVAHAVSVMILQAAGARTLMGVCPSNGAASGAGFDEVNEALVAVEAAGVAAMKELHRLLGLLRAVEPDQTGDHSPAPGLADMARLIETSRAAGLEVERLVEGTARDLDRSVDLAAYRVVQEALTNAAKHSGPGTSVRVHEVWADTRLCLSARSCRGFTAATTPRPAGDGPDVQSGSGFGLRGLAERVTLVGGRFESGSLDNGFLVQAEFPLDHSSEGAP